MKQRLYRGITIIGLTISLCVPYASSEAFIASMKGLGMGDTGVAFPQDAESGAYNPATISWVGDRVDLGLSVIRADGDTTVTGNAIPTQNGNFNAYNKHYYFNPQFGITKNFCLFGRRFTGGFVVYNRDEAFVKYDRSFPILGTSPIRLSFIREILAPMISWNITNCMTVGVSLDIILQRLKVNGLENFDTSFQFRSTAPGFVTNNGPSVAAGVGVTFGWLWQIIDGLKIGLSYSPEVNMGAFGRYKGFIAEGGRFNTPQKFAGGISAKFTPCLTAAFDVTHEGWNKIPALHNPLTIPAFLGAPFGSAFGWRDRTFYRGGFNYTVSEKIDIRMGVRHARVPLPKSQTAANLLTMTIVEDFITAGFTYRFDCNMDFNFYYAHGFRYKVKGEDSVPPELGGGEVDLAKSRDAVGFSLGMWY